MNSRKSTTYRLLSLGCTVCLLFFHTISYCQNYPSGFSQVLVANGISNPTVMAFAPDGRIFVGEQGGKLRVIKNNTLLTDPFISLTVQSSGERGLIGIALDPEFSSNNYIYLYYTVPGSPPHNRIIRVTANGDQVLANSESLVLDLDNLSGATNHNGGAMHFGTDGKLYVAVGENANTAHAQNLDTYHGKFLRINKDGSIPAGNPFTTGSEQRRRVWSYGLRNPYTFDVQPGTGRIFLNDVGQGTWEEINDATDGGQNFGWPQAEGNSTNPAFSNPVYAYQHGSGDGRGCAITGGTFFNPTQTNYPSEYLRKYFYQEYCNNWINYIDFSGATVTRYSFATQTSGSGLSLSVGTDGNLYYLSRSAGALYKIVYNNSTSPTITQHPASITVSEKQTANFTVTAVGSTPLTYQWKKNGIDIPNATSSSYTIANVLPGHAGQYTVTVTNAVGNVTSNAATLTVTPVNDPPAATISLPVHQSTYIAGTSIDFSGTGTDPEDGDLAGNAFSWQIDFHHADHKHDQPAITGVTNGSFQIPDEGETSDDVFYRFILTVTDSEGLEDKDSVDILPRKSTLNLTTDPEGIQLTLDGQPFDTPGSVVSVEGLKRSIGAPLMPEIDGVTYEFVEWEHGGDPVQTIVTPSDDIAYKAIFSPVLAIDDDLEKSIVVFPNPVKRNNNTMVSIRSTQNQPLQVQVVDFLSRRILVGDKSGVESGDVIQIGTQSYQPGVYAVLIKVGERQVVKKLMILN